ncbi:hypothetical protein H8356DRAFT_1353389 [Neocallimastix lanati (nom. inval.)]|nr:hypothetical protein H8356DRAFT_1353389 [Neocallimastix sp. JGI-2020a]
MKQEEPLFYNDYKRKKKIIESNLIDNGRPRKDIVGFRKRLSEFNYKIEETPKNMK